MQACIHVHVGIKFAVAISKCTCQSVSCDLAWPNNNFPLAIVHCSANNNRFNVSTSHTAHSHPSLFVNSPLLMLSVPNQANTEFPIQDYPIQLRLTPVYPNATVCLSCNYYVWYTRILGNGSLFPSRVFPDILVCIGTLI